MAVLDTAIFFMGADDRVKRGHDEMGIKQPKRPRKVP